MPKWTDEQRLAIEESGGALLVAAAAGSGKTAVLVERVLRRLTDPVSPSDIDRLLLVTYTNAAAAEMRGKIADAIAGALALDPKNTRLRRQLLLVHRAQIETVHAFCLRLAREQFAALGITPDFAVADEAAAAALREEALEEVIEDSYEVGGAGFLALSDLLSAGRDDSRLCEVVRQIYERIQSHTDPDAFLEQVRRVFVDPAGSKAHRETLLEQARVSAAYGLACLERAQAEMEADETLQAAYGPAFAADCAHARGLLCAIDEGWEAAVAAAAALTHDRLGAVRGYEDKAFQEYVKALRKEWRTAADQIAGKWLCTNAEAEAYDRTLVAPAMDALIDTVRAFARAFAARKRERGLVDFSDLEHFAIRLLWKDGKPTALAASVAAGFDEIMVDEYQDSNRVQEAIFRAVSREGRNLFFVGDVKQSIYGFRLADPSIFLEKYRAYADAQTAAEGAPRRVNLTRNFRSRAQVLEAANYIFGKVMREWTGDLDYTEREALYVGADYPEPDHPRYQTEVLLLDTAETPDDGPDKTTLEAQMVAARICALLDEGFPVYDRTEERQRPAEMRDIVILLRSVSRKAAVYRAALEQAGLVAETDENTGLLATAEVSAIVSLLSVIDNPRQDIPLIGALRSPLFGFSEQELAEIRLAARDADYLDALTAAAESGMEKAALFLQQLKRLRLLAADLPVYRLLALLYDEMGVLGLYGAQSCGAQRQANLLAFLERARAFEARAGRGLFRFCAMLRGMQERGEDFPAAQAHGGGGAVRIMSIHKSKGLEFPIVIVADCAKEFNEQDRTAPVLVHPTLGLGPKCRDLARGIQYPSLWRQAIAVRSRREAVSEEMRVLYVAMTRPKEKLILTASSAQMQQHLKKCAMTAALPRLPDYALGAVRSFLPWLLMPLLRHPAAGVLRQTAEAELVPDPHAPDVFAFRILRPEELKMPDAFSAEKTKAEDLFEISPDLVYPHEYLQDIPAKMTATGLKQTYKAAEAAEDTVPVLQEMRLRQPVFDRELRGLAPTEIGTAHHLFMQFCDFAACVQENGVQAELARLKEKRILAPEQAAAIDCKVIERFFCSSLYQKWFCTGQVRREFKFSVLVPAMLYEPVAAQTPEETVLLQGVIDCLIEVPEGYLVVDFKTDRITKQNAETCAQKYQPQLAAYALAVQKIFGRNVVGQVLYFLSTGDEVWLSG